ncbi:uncharacterized protein LOC123498161 isoform X2 [Portunus trituberculatus]|uniref:uncharacterized protein LOC123498161 isoform X2 n=1 Tax=Portunus trituberculatus TaxID=210409 RepID=UPI001E1CFF4A|nr:uncharacterized protein LOC123498161 isoform X2 [Portunus trituberculatus]
MLAVKKYFNPRRRRNSAEFDSSGLVCTCPYGSPRPSSPAPPLPVPGAAGGREGAGTDSPPLARRHQYRRSVSLGQILHRSDSSSSDISTLYNPGRRYYRDPRGSPRPHTHALHAHAHADHPDNAGHELSDFEKENLLFVRDLDNSYHRPLCHSTSNASICSAFSEDSLTGDSSAPSSVATSSAWWTNTRPPFKTPANLHPITCKHLKLPPQTSQHLKLPPQSLKHSKLPP